MDKLSAKLKEILNKDKKTSNLILIIVLLVILLIAMNYIFNSDTLKDDTSRSVVSDNIQNINANNTEIKLAEIIKSIGGVENASVMISYSTTEKIIPVYDTKEDVDTTSDEDKTSTKKTTEKKVAYEDGSSGKSAIVESKETANANGAIIVVKGDITELTKNDIKEAVAMVTNVPLHKIQIFSN